MLRSHEMHERHSVEEGWTYGEAWGGCPSGQVGRAADDGFVDVACADEAEIVD